MISQTAEYALRAIAHLAEHYGEPCTSHQIAEATHVPQDYMSKVLKGLVNAGIISSQRGLYGGFRLNRPPGEVRIIDVINAVSPVQRIHECPLGKVHAGGVLCPLHRLLDDAMEQIETAFTDMTIGELLESDREGSAICADDEAGVDVSVGGKSENGPPAGAARRRRPKSTSSRDSSRSDKKPVQE